MKLAHQLQTLLGDGVHRIGEIEILTEIRGHLHALCHADDRELASQPSFGGLEVHHGPAAARDLSTYSSDGSYRFVKAEINLRRGWLMLLENASELLLALDHFYPAAVGLHLAKRNGVIEVQNLRDKLERQTGMYQGARRISDEGAQALVRQICGPAHRCAKKILWQIDDATPLEDSEASRFNGIPGQVTEAEAIPLLCREACNHFVAECRKAVKKR